MEPTCGLEKAHEDAERDRLADAAAAQDAEGLAAIDREADVVQYLALAEPHGNVPERDQRPACGRLVGRDGFVADDISHDVPGDLGVSGDRDVGLRGRVRNNIRLGIGRGHEISLLEDAASGSESARARSVGVFDVRNQVWAGRPMESATWPV